MTENEKITINGKEVTLYREVETNLYRFSKDAVDMLLEALEEREQYRAIGTVEDIEKGIKQSEEEFNMLMEYRAIGTIEEFKDLKEKSFTITNGKWIDTQPEYSNGYYKNVHVCSNCSDYYTTEYDEMNFCPKCGAKMTET